MLGNAVKAGGASGKILFLQKICIAIKSVYAVANLRLTQEAIL